MAKKKAAKKTGSKSKGRGGKKANTDRLSASEKKTYKQIKKAGGVK